MTEHRMTMRVIYARYWRISFYSPFGLMLDCRRRVGLFGTVKMPLEREREISEQCLSLVRVASVDGCGGGNRQLFQDACKFVCIVNGPYWAGDGACIRENCFAASWR